MKRIFLIPILAFAIALVGCKTLNPETGEKEFDPVKTAQVRAAIKPAVSTLVTSVIINNPTSLQYFQVAGTNICKLRDDHAVSLSAFKEALNSAFSGWEGAADPVVAGAINTLIALVEINYANRLRADLPEEEFAWNLIDVICDGITQGITLAPQ